MKKDKLLLNPLWNLENAEANLKDDIQFLRCIDSEYFQKGKIECSAFLYWQFEAIIRTLRKSLECTQMNMKKSIDAIYEKDSKEKKGVVENGYKGNYKE